MEKFKSLWQAGHTANLFLETQAGQAWVTLKVALGPHPAEQAPPQNYPRQLSPSQWRRLQRRKAARNAEETNGVAPRNYEENACTTTEKDVDQNLETLKEADASAIVDQPEVGENVGENVETENVLTQAATNVKTCVICDKRFASEKGLQTHLGKSHGNIPQLDGVSDDETKELIYTFVSNYGEEDVLYTMQELLELKLVPSLPVLVSRVKINNGSADHLCTVRLRLLRDQFVNFAWPEVPGYPGFCRNVTRLPSISTE